LAAVLDHPDEMVRMAANAAAHASRFSWDNTAAATLRAYAQAIDSHRAAVPG
jgi:D-inositol-3-phosphate glycosyltransferase